jgi:hypothetical protein
VQRRRPAGVRLCAPRLALVLATLTMPLVAAACSTPSVVSDTSDSEALTSYDATVAANSAAITSTFSIDEQGNRPSAITVSGQGTYTWTTNVGQMDYQTHTRSKVSGLNNIALQWQEIVEGNSVYTQTTFTQPVGVSGGASSTSAAGWTKQTWSGNTGSDMLSALMASVGLRPETPPIPGQMLQLLHTSAASIRNLGPSTVDGVPTTHYQAELPLTALEPPNESALMAAERELGATSLPIDFWVDGSQRLREMRLDVSVQNPSPQQQASSGISRATVGFDSTFSDYGVPVSISPPPASEITGTSTCTGTKDGFNCTSSNGTSVESDGGH